MSNRDPLASLIEYVGTVKPYHTKVYEVILEYAYQEPIKATVGEHYEIYTLMTTPEANKWNVSEGIGWDTGPFDMDQTQAGNMGQWDFPLISTVSSPSQVMAYISEQLSMMIEMFPADQILAQINTDAGWDVIPWDTAAWDALPTPKLQFEQQDADADPVGATITESLVIYVDDETIVGTQTQILTAYDKPVQGATEWMEKP